MNGIRVFVLTCVVLMSIMPGSASAVWELTEVEKVSVIPVGYIVSTFIDGGYVSYVVGRFGWGTYGWVPVRSDVVVWEASSGEKTVITADLPYAWNECGAMKDGKVYIVSYEEDAPTVFYTYEMGTHKLSEIGRVEGERTYFAAVSGDEVIIRRLGDYHLLSGGVPDRLTFGQAVYGGYEDDDVCSVTGDLLVWVHFSDFATYVTDILTKATKRVSSGSGASRGIVVDGSHAVWETRANGSSEYYCYNLQTGGRTKVGSCPECPEQGLDSIVTIRYPDVFYVMATDGEWMIRSHNVVSGVDIALFRSSLPISSLAAQGRDLFFYTSNCPNIDQCTEVNHIDLKTREVVRLTTSGPGGIADPVRIDNGEIAFTHYENGVWRVYHGKQTDAPISCAYAGGGIGRGPGRVTFGGILNALALFLLPACWIALIRMKGRAGEASKRGPATSTGPSIFLKTWTRARSRENSTRVF